MWFLNIYLQYGLLWIGILISPLIACNWITNLVTNFLKRRKSMRGKVVLITGTGSGIGRALACLLAKENCVVICVDKNSKANDETIKIIQSFQNLEEGRAISIICDISDASSVETLAKNVLNQYQKLDILINNAGVSFFNPLLKTSTFEIEKTIQVNLMSHFWAIQAFLPAMKARKSGMIVATSSASAIFPTGNIVAYSASKAGVTGLMESLYHELRLEKSPIKILTIHPGFTGTNMMPEKYREPQLLDGYIKIVSPKWMAKQIIGAIKEGKRFVMIPANLNIAVYFMNYLIPEWLRHYIMQYLLNSQKYLIAK